MSATFWTAIASIRARRNNALALCASLLVFLVAPGGAQTPAPTTATQVLALAKHAVSQGKKAPRTLESIGTLSGANLRGTFHAWRDGERERVDQNLGLRVERTLQLSNHRYVQTSNGDVIELGGLLERRAVTQSFIGSPEFFDQPQHSKFLGHTKLADGRDVYQLEVTPPNGETETVDIDAQTYLIDRLEYIDGDGVFTTDFADYRPVHGYLMSFRQIDSDGDHPYDITQIITKTIPDVAIAPSVFAPFVPALLRAAGPVTVPIVERNGALYTDVTIHGRTFTFLIDSGAQGIVLDSRVATQLGMVPEGSFEARGTSRTGGIGVAALDEVHIGAAVLPVHVASILDLAGATSGRFAIDGILGYTLFGAASVQIDYAHKTMTIASPGVLAGKSPKIAIDVDRELPEMQAVVNGTEGRFLVDTGNGNELLLFHPFVEAHQGLLRVTLRAATPSYGVGGATRAYEVNVDLLEMGSYRMFHRNTSVILSTEGAFADRFDAGNIGLGILKNFVVTFDAFNRTMYLDRGANFDDGRDRHPTEDIPTHWH